jgi:hypothetical protein
MSVGDPRAAQEVVHLTRHVLERGDGRAHARRGRARHQGTRRTPQLPTPRAHAPPPNVS